MLNNTITATLLTLAVQAVSNTTTGRFAFEQMVKAFEALHDRTSAGEHAKACLEQAIITGKAGVTTNPVSGKRLDTTGPFRTRLESAVNRAYKDGYKDTFAMTTSGKGAERTVSITFRKIKGEREKIEARIKNLLDDIGASPAEMASLSARLLGLYDAEQDKAKEAKIDAQVAAHNARLAALEALDVQAKAYIEARGLEVTDETLALARTFLDVGGNLTATN